MGLRRSRGPARADVGARVKAIQQILTITTSRPALRADATGWGAEDPSLLRPGPIGYTPGFPGGYCYPTPFHALADGWHLLGPPASEQVVINGDTGEKGDEWTWWMARTVEVPR